jgi:hypothetical protein
MKNKIKTFSLILVTLLGVGVGCGSSNSKKLQTNSLHSQKQWDGVIKKTDRGQKIPIKITASNGQYNIKYPSLSCVGKLNLLSSNNDEMIFRIDIIEGSCPTNGIIKMQNIDENEVQFYQFNQNGNLTGASNVVINKKTISGRVVDENGNPVSNMTVKLEYLVNGEEESSLAQTNSQGYYSISIDEDKLKNVDDTSFLIYAYKDGYIPVTNSFKINSNRNFNIDFTTNHIKPNEVVLEIEPKVHHLGDDQYNGSINSQFQKNTEGIRFHKSFHITQSQYENYDYAELTFSAKGIQGTHYGDEVILNNQSYVLEQSNADGSYKTYSLNLDKNSYNIGENNIEVTSGFYIDYDDFEFANIIIRFGKGKLQTGSTIRQGSSALQSKIENTLNHYISHRYSYLRQGIFAVGKKNGAYYFYRFNANPVKLEKVFQNIGINSNATINDIEAKPNGNFLIYTDYGNYMFNYFDGQLTNLSNNYVQRPTNTQTSSNITPGNTGFIKTYHGGGRLKISNGTLSRYSGNGEYEATIREGINSIVPLPKGKVLVLTTDGKVEVINYLDYPFRTLSSTSTNLTSIEGGTYSDGTVYVGSQSFDVSRFTE